MAPPSANGVGVSTIGRGPSSSPPLGLRPQFRRQGSSYGPSHVHHMAVMVAPKRVDYSVNKGGLKSWIVLIVFVLLCSAILTIFSEDGAESESANEAMSDSQKEGEEEEIDGGAANIPSAGIAADEVEDDDDEDDDGEDEEDEKEEKEEEEEEEEEEEKDQKQKKNAEEEEERMLARLKEAAAMARRRQKEEANKMKAKREAEKRERIEQAEHRERERKKREQEEEEEANREEEREEQRDKDAEMDGDGMVEEQQEEEEEEQQQQQQQMLGRDRHEKKQKRVPSWRETQLQAAKEDTQKPRKNLLKQRKKRNFAQLKSKYGTDKKKREEEEEEEKEEEEEMNEEEEEAGAANVAESELSATRKRPIYNRKALTNRYDYKHRSLLDEADFLMEKHQFDAALRNYEHILAINKQSPRALFGRGRLRQLEAEFASEKDDPNKFIRMALSDYSSVLENEDTPDELFKMTVLHFVKCAKILGGQHHKILQAQRSLMDRFPDDADIKCDFGATWLSMARPEKAAEIFRDVLEIDPHHALAMAYLGYIQKVHDNDLERGVHMLRRAMRTDDGRVTGDVRFYFHLGDGLVKLGRTREALEVYTEAVKHGLFPSVLQRSAHNLLGLSAHPWWAVDQIECAKLLRVMERQWTAIREEGLQAWHKRRHLFVEEALPMASGTVGGEWALTLRSNALGGFKEGVCDRLMHSTCELLRQFAVSNCAKDKIKLSVLLAGTRTWPFCGPTNYVLEAQLALVAQSDARIRVGNETKGWRPGHFLLFDTSFEREISFEGAPSNAIRLALVMELWHPQMPLELRGKIHADGTEEQR